MAAYDSSSTQPKPMLFQSETSLLYPISNTNDSPISPCLQTANEIPQAIQWDDHDNDIPISCVGKPDLSRSRTSSGSSSLSSAYSDICTNDIDESYDDTQPIYIESQVLTRAHTIDVALTDILTDIGMPQSIHENDTQDSYDSASDSEPDHTPTPTARCTFTALQTQKTHKIYVQNSGPDNDNDHDNDNGSQSAFDYNDEILPHNTPTLVNHSTSSFDIGLLPALPGDGEESGINTQEMEITINPTIANVRNVKSIQTLPTYKWQKPIINEENYGAFYPNFQREIMNNPFFNLSPGDFNDVLKKCQFIRSRWIGEKIRSSRPGKLGKHKWKMGEKISELDLFAIKLYTDFEVCQRELKKCYRPPANGDQCELYQYEQRLCYFSNWRRLLNVAILKYGTFLKNRVFYHGINKIMQLDIHPTNRCHGPFSATSDVEIARGFATKNGLILKMTSKFPRLGTDYFFDAAPISAYPDEKEYLIGFLYTRILNVSLGCTKLCVSDLQHETVDKLMCFILVSLIKNNIYSYGPYLELLFHALLYTDPAYKCSDLWADDDEDELLQIASMIPQIIRDELMRIRGDIKILKLDRISRGMQSLFCEDDQMLSLRKMYEYAPNMQELHLYENEYEIDNEFICNFLYFIKLYGSKLKLETIKCFKYSFEGSSQQFQFKRSISKSNEMKLQTLGWHICQYHTQNCYKFILTKKKK